MSQTISQEAVLTDYSWGEDLRPEIRISQSACFADIKIGPDRKPWTIETESPQHLADELDAYASLFRYAANRVRKQDAAAAQIRHLQRESMAHRRAILEHCQSIAIAAEQIDDGPLGALLMQHARRLASRTDPQDIPF